MTLMTSPAVTSPSLFPFNLSQAFGTFVNGAAKADFIYVILATIKSTSVTFLVCPEAPDVKWIFYNN